MYLTLTFVYPSRAKFRKIRSIIPNSVTIGEDLVVEESVNFSRHLKSIGDGTYIGKRTYIGYCHSIGKFTSISLDVKIGLPPHPMSFVSTSPLFYAVRRGFTATQRFDESENGFCSIGNDVLISANAMILSGIKIGDGAVIGAGAVVNMDVQPYAVVAGVPARVLRFRFTDEVKYALQASGWWQSRREKLQTLSDCMNDVEEFLRCLKIGDDDN